MSQHPAEGRFRKNVQDALVFVVAVALSTAAIVTFGVTGLAAGCVLLSLAAAVVVGREESATTVADDRAMATDGGHED